MSLNAGIQLTGIYCCCCPGQHCWQAAGHRRGCAVRCDPPAGLRRLRQDLWNRCAFHYCPREHQYRHTARQLLTQRLSAALGPEHALPSAALSHVEPTVSKQARPLQCLDCCGSAGTSPRCIFGHVAPCLSPCSTGASGPSSAAPHTQAATSAPTAADATPSASTSHTIQETTKSAEQVYTTHATVAAAAAAAGGLVGGAHLSVRTAANVAEAAVDPAAVVDFDCMSPTSASADTAGDSADQQLQADLSSVSTAGQDGAGAEAAGEASTQEGSGDSMAGHAVLPEDREDVAATLQRLRCAGQVHSPDGFAGASTDPSTDASTAATADDTFIGAAAATSAGTRTDPVSSSSAQGSGPSSKGSSVGRMTSSFSAAAGAGHPSAQGVSAGTAAPALAGYPDPTIGTAAEDVNASAATAAQEAATDPNSSSGLLATHDAAARAAAVAGALAHIGTPISTAAELAETATQPAQAVEAAAAVADAASATSRVSSLHKQHTLAEFLLDEPATAAAMASHHSAGSSAGATAASSLYQVDLSAGTAAADDDFEVQLDVGRSTQLLNPDGRVAAAAATVPDEAVAAINTAESAEAPKSPRHSSLRQLSMSRQPDAGSSSQEDKPAGSLPYGLTVADIVAATVASEERRFRVVSPRGSPRGPGSGYFTASSGSTPSTPHADAAAAQGIERSSSPMSASATRAIFDSVQLAVQQQQEQEQLALSVARSASLGKRAGSRPAGSGASGAAGAFSGVQDSGDASTTARMASAGSGDSTATSSRASSAGSAGMPAAADGSSAALSPAPAEVTEQNAEVMQEMLQAASGSAQGADALALLAAAAVSAAAGADALSTDSTASQCGDSEQYKTVLRTSMDGSDAQAGSEPGSSASAGDRLAAAVAAAAADPIAAAAAGTDVAATASPAFPTVVFGVGAMPVDLPALSRSPDSIESGPSSGGTDAAGIAEDLSTAAALASTGLASLNEENGMQDSKSAAAEDPAVRQVIDATSAAVISPAGMDAPATAAAAAAAAATEMHQDSPDPAVAAASAAQLVVDAANTVPGLLAPADVASAAAAAGAAAAAAATPGMDPTSAAIACAAAAANPMGDPEDVAAAATRAVASMQDSASSSQAGGSGTGGGQQSSFSGSGGVGGDLTGLLPILAPSGEDGDAIAISSSSSSSASSTGDVEGAGLAAASTMQGSAMPAQLQTVPETAALEGSSTAGVGGDAGAGQFVGTAEVLNKEGLGRMFDPLIVQLAMASSAPLEGLGLDASTLPAAAGGNAAAIAAAGRAFTNSSSFGSAGSGVLMMQQHPLAGAVSLGGAPSLGPGPVEGSTMYTHLEAAEEALAQLDSSDLQRQRTDSISLGAGRSSALGELDEAAATGGVSAAAEVPEGAAE